MLLYGQIDRLHKMWISSETSWENKSSMIAVVKIEVYQPIHVALNCRASKFGALSGHVHFLAGPRRCPLITAFRLQREEQKRRQPWVFDHPRHLPSRICPHPGATRRWDILTISKFYRVFFLPEFLLIDEVWLILSPDTFVDVVVFIGVDNCFHPPILPCTLSLKNILTIILDRLWTLSPWTWS